MRTLPQKAWNLFPGDGEKRVKVNYIDAAGNFSPGYTASIILDSTRPSGFSISINGGAQYTNDTNAILSVSAGGQNTAGIQMAIGIWLPFPFPGQIAWGDWQPFAATVPATLNKQFPQRYARFKDAAGNVSDTVSDSIILTSGLPRTASSRPPGAINRSIWSGRGSATTSSAAASRPTKSIAAPYLSRRLPDPA